MAIKTCYLYNNFQAIMASVPHNFDVLWIFVKNIKIACLDSLIPSMAAKSWQIWHNCWQICNDHKPYCRPDAVLTVVWETMMLKIRQEAAKERWETMMLKIRQESCKGKMGDYDAENQTGSCKGKMGDYDAEYRTGSCRGKTLLCFIFPRPLCPCNQVNITFTDMHW